MRMLAIDMDGTCLNDRHRISGKNLNALRMAAEAGIEIVPTTGRALSCLPYQLRSEKYIRYIISSNGAVVTDLKDKQTIFEALIPCDTALSILKECEGMGLGVMAHADTDSLVEGKTLAAFGRLSYGRDASNSICVRSISEYLKANRADVEELQFFLFSAGTYERTMKVLEKYPSIIAASASKYVEAFSAEATKGNAVAALAAHLGFRKEHIACVGDSENDLPMFRSAGLKFAMGNAVQELKDAADHVVPSNNKDGVAAVIQRYLL